MLPDELLNKYNVLQLLHHGIGGDVWLAEHKSLGGRRVLKTIERSHPQYHILVNEAKILQQCQHSSIPIIYDILEFDTQTYIVEEFIQGENLKQYIIRQKNISASLLLEISRQLCDILLFLHNPARRILHLDIKPENILLLNHKLKLIDFGSAICQNQNEKRGLIFGTPAYCAPEMLKMGSLTERTDIYCMGKCMEYLMFHATDVPKGYRRIVERCLRKTGKDYVTAEQIKKDLDRVNCKKKKEEKREHWYAVTGVLSEHDSSMTALQLAMYLRDCYHKPVLYLDCTEERVTEQAEQPAQQKKIIGDIGGFMFERNGITVAKRVALQEISGWRNRGYSFVVICFGTKSPLLSDCLFDGCILSGAVTELCLMKWKAMMSVSEVYPTAIALTGGDGSLAAREWRERCRIKKLPSYFETFGPAKPFKRQMKSLLKKM